MNEHEIRQLVKIVEESDIGELEIRRWGTRIRISKTPSGAVIAPNTAPGAPPVAATPVAPPPIQQAAPEAGEEVSKTSETGVEIKSPMVGTFYRSPSPEAQAYVKVNDVIKKGQVLCIIEAMKLMNEIESEQDGRIVEILIKDGQPVEYNQPLFLIEPT